MLASHAGIGTATPVTASILHTSLYPADSHTFPRTFCCAHTHICVLCPLTHMLHGFLISHHLLPVQIKSLSAAITELAENSIVLPVGSKPIPHNLRPGCPGFWSHSAVFIAQSATSGAAIGQVAAAKQQAAKQSVAGLSRPSTHTYPAH